MVRVKSNSLSCCAGGSSVKARIFRSAFLIYASFFALVIPMCSQGRTEETLGGPDSHETGQGPHGHLFGEWGGERSRLEERGVRFDFQYVSDSLWNIHSEQNERFASWNRFRGTVDVDFGALMEKPGLYFHATALWQGGGNLGAYLGLLTSPSGMSSMNTCRLDSWWLEKRWLNERLTARVGQFAGQDFYGAQHYAASFIFEPMGYALGNLFTVYESFDPPSTPATEVRVVPIHDFYVKSMVEAEDREPFAHNPTGLVPQFRGVPVSISEIGFTPGKKATGVRAFDTVESRKGYSGLYQFGASYNPGKFTTASGAIQSGNYLMYWMANQAIWRVNPKRSEGTGRNPFVRLESCEHQPQQYDAHCGFALQRAAASADPQHDVTGLRTEPPESAIRAYRARRHGSRSKALNSIRSWTHCPCFFCSR